MKWLRTLVLSLAVFFMAGRPSHATFIVFDPTSYSQQLISYINQIREYVQQCQQYATQLKQLAAEIQNLQSLNYLIDLSGFQDLQNIIKAARGLASDYSTLQSKFDQIYPEFSKFSSMSAKDYSIKALLWNQETANTNRDALDLISKAKDWFNSDTGELKSLTVKANNVSGAKDGLQAIAQIAALQSKQLVQLQQTMSASAKTEGAYMAQKAEQEAAGSYRLQNWGKDFTADKYREKQEKAKKPYWDKTGGS